MLGRALLDVRGELAGAAKYSGDLYQAGTKAIHDPERADDELAQVRRADLGNHSADLRELDQSLRSEDKAA